MATANIVNNIPHSSSRAREKSHDSTVAFHPNLKKNLVQEGYLQGESARTDLAS